MFSTTNRPTKQRGPAKKVTKAEAVVALRRLREAAAAGNVTANAALVALAEDRLLPLERSNG
ncbi:hypothetical protein E0E50_15205 [Azotobacter chroococcum subsp. isscasi]|nr:hypothetical protein E0E50_15205 [Azotobacter chroococcum subsp. isscasi]